MYISETYSTNSLMKQLLARGEWPEGEEILYTDYQTAGRGQVGNTWESEEGKNILLSVLLRRPSIKIEEQFVLSEVFPLAVVEAVESIVGEIGLRIKWPNDIYYGNNKLAGILIENTLSEGQIENAILGIGLDVNQTEWHSDAPNPISLRQITGREWDRQTLIDAIVSRLKKRLEKWNREDLKQAYMLRLFRRDEYANYADSNGMFKAAIRDIDEFGQLVLEDEKGIRRTYGFKEIKYIL